LFQFLNNAHKHNFPRAPGSPSLKTERKIVRTQEQSSVLDTASPLMSARVLQVHALAAAVQHCSVMAELDLLVATAVMQGRSVTAVTAAMALLVLQAQPDP
jgi:hypothetical protein